MVTAGIDVGHRTSKLVLVKDGDIINKRVAENSDESKVIAENILNTSLKETDIGTEDIDFTVTTGAMGKGISFSNLYRTSMACLARGVFEVFPKARTVIDLGGETCTVFKMDTDGLIMDMQANDKCAAGTGIFFEAMAKLLGVSMEEMGILATRGTKNFEISSMCVVFAEQEVISHAHENPDISAADLAASLHASIAARVAGLAKRLTIEDEVVLTGGCAKNPGYVKYMGEILKADVKVPEDPQGIMAYGAALIAREKGGK
jgi:predicted CoA-substrate-specific enzyme activase